MQLLFFRWGCCACMCMCVCALLELGLDEKTGMWTFSAIFTIRVPTNVDLCFPPSRVLCVAE